MGNRTHRRPDAGYIGAGPLWAADHERLTTLVCCQLVSYIAVGKELILVKVEKERRGKERKERKGVNISFLAVVVIEQLQWF